MEMNFCNNIVQDIHRTFPTHAYFCSTGAGNAQMIRVLKAFSKRNPLIGYSQSFTFIVGILLLFYSELEAFYMFVRCN